YRRATCPSPIACSISRPFGTCVPCGIVPGVKTPGYSQDVPPGQRNVPPAFSAKQATRFIDDAFKAISRPRCPARKMGDTLSSESVDSLGYARVLLTLAWQIPSRGWPPRG